MMMQYTHIRRIITDTRKHFSSIAILSIISAAFVIGIFFVRKKYKIAFPILTADPMATLNAPFYTGLLSNLGIICWAMACAFCFLSYSKSKHVGMRQFFLYFGLFTTLIMQDDLFMFHEQVFPHYLGIPEIVTLSVYGSVGLFIFLRFFDIILHKTPVSLFVISILLISISTFIDVFMNSFKAEYLVEDGLKFTGILFWAGYLYHCSIMADWS